MEVVYEDNHIIIVNKAPGEIVQGDKTGDKPLVDIVKDYLKEKYCKPGNVFCGVVHRIDRPVGGLVIFAKTSKALSRMNALFQSRDIQKYYWAIIPNTPIKSSGTHTHYITTVEKNNKSYASEEPKQGASLAVLDYKILSKGDNYSLVEVQLHTGRKHQIRVQLSYIGCPIKGDLKYGSRRSNLNGSISLQSHRVVFTHPVSGKVIDVTAPVPNDKLWQSLVDLI